MSEAVPAHGEAAGLEEQMLASTGWPYRQPVPKHGPGLLPPGQPPLATTLPADETYLARPQQAGGRKRRRTARSPVRDVATDGTAWPPNSRWAKIRTDDTFSAWNPERVERWPIAALGESMSAATKAIADRQSEIGRPQPVIAALKDDVMIDAPQSKTNTSLFGLSCYETHIPASF